MRILVISVAICLLCSCLAHSQKADKSDAQPENMPVYFLVDASGTMQGQNKTDAELLLRALSLPHDQLVSVIYFGSKPAALGADLCFEELDVRSPERRGEAFAPEYPKLGDQTAITNAIDSVLGKVVGPAKIVVITDGGEECDRNFGGVRVRYPNANIEIRQVGDNPNAELQKLESPTPVASVSSRWAPTVNFEYRSETPKPVLNAWEQAEWYERRVWLAAAISLLVSSWLWGSSFGRRANYYESENDVKFMKREKCRKSSWRRSFRKE